MHHHAQNIMLVLIIFVCSGDSVLHCDGGHDGEATGEYGCARRSMSLLSLPCLLPLHSVKPFLFIYYYKSHAPLGMPSQLYWLWDQAEGRDHVSSDTCGSAVWPLFLGSQTIGHQTNATLTQCERDVGKDTVLKWVLSPRLIATDGWFLLDFVPEQET